MRVQVVDKLSDEQREILVGWGEDLFSLAQYGLSWRAKERRLLRYEDDRLVAKASVLTHQVCAGGRRVRGRRSHYDTRGAEACHASAVMNRVAGYIRDEVMIHQPAGEVISPLPVMVLACTAEAWPEGMVRLGSEPW